ncbi:MAG: hypothetical protein OXF73_01045 [Gammaproteobacteria bacterium]|nr:hypothetical protein [Gammaproteobacteria bacterium]
MMYGRRPKSQPVKINLECPNVGSDRNYLGIAPTGTHDLSQTIALGLCVKPLKYLLPNSGIGDGNVSGKLLRSMVIRLKGKVVMLADGGYAAFFGPHDSAWNCGPTTWPSAAHQAAGLPPYAKWCDLSFYWRAR